MEPFQLSLRLPVALCLLDGLFLDTAHDPEGHDLPLPVGYILHIEPIGSLGEAEPEPTQRLGHSQSMLSLHSAPGRWWGKLRCSEAGQPLLALGWLSDLERITLLCGPEDADQRVSLGDSLG